MAAIYVIECNINGFVYVGCSAAKLGKRMREHRCLAKNGTHTARGLVDDWQRYGDAAFAIRAVEILPPDASIAVKREAELRWMGLFSQQGRLYNDNHVSFGAGITRNPITDETRRKLSRRRSTPEANLKRRLAQIGKPKGHGAKISATKKALGQRPSPEAVRKGNHAMQLTRYGRIVED